MNVPFDFLFMVFILGMIAGILFTIIFTPKAQKVYQYRTKSKYPNYSDDLRTLCAEYGLDKQQFFEIRKQITAFRHYTQTEQTDMLIELSKYPKIANYLRKIQELDTQ